LTKRYGAIKILLAIAIAFLVLSVALAVVSLFPRETNNDQTNILINSFFTLSPNEVYRQGLGSFHGGENISILVYSPTECIKNFSIITYNGTHYSNPNSNISYSFTATADYYDAVFSSNSLDSSIVHFQATVQKTQALFPNSWLTEPSKIMFLISVSLTMGLMLKIFFTKSTKFEQTMSGILKLNEKSRRVLIVLVVLSFVFWTLLIALNTTPLATFENWYTDHARHSYVSSLFLKDGFSVFETPLGKLANVDNSYYKFVTWPQMPHLYPLGSIFLFLPFGLLLQHGLDPSLIYKIEILVFLIFATVSLYLFLERYFKKDMFLLLKLIGVYIIYVSLVTYAVDGMFDSVAFLFSLVAIFMFMSERYDYFFLLVTVSIFFKYQAGIFLFPLIIVGLIRLFQTNKFSALLRNKAVVAGFVFGFASIFTAYLSIPYLMATGPQLIMNGVNAFSSNSQIVWSLQSSSVLLMLAVTIAYSVYMLNKNSLLSISALFLLLPSFILPYFQNWYLPFIFIYILIPQKKRELEMTMLWLIFMIFMLSFGGVAFSPSQIFSGFSALLNKI